MTVSPVQEIPNRVNSGAGKATIGSTTSADTNDPLVLNHDGEHYIHFPGAGANTISVPDTAANSITGDIDIRCRVAATDWTSAQTLLHKRTTSGGNASWQFRLTASGDLELVWTTDGSTFVTATSTAVTGVADAAARWTRVTLDVDNGASGYDAKFYLSDDGTTWTQLGATVTGGSTTSIYDGTSVVGFGAFDSSISPFSGDFYRGQLYNGIDGTKVLDINPTVDIDTSADPDAGQSTFTATTGQTVTVNRGTSGLVTTVVTRPVAVLDGSDDHIQLPTDDAATFTKTAGKHTVVVLFRNWIDSNFGRLFSTESSSNNGSSIQIDATTFYTYVGDGAAPHSFRTRSFSAGVLTLGAYVIDDGSLYGYTDSAGLSAATTITNDVTGTIVHDSAARVGTVAGVSGNRFIGEVFAALTFKDRALTEGQLDTLADMLKSGSY